MYSNGNYDLKSDWFYWSINGNKWSTPGIELRAGRGIKNFTFHPYEQLPRDVDNIRDETTRYILDISKEHTKFAVCLSGMDSEIIARTLVSLKLDVEFYYIRFWFEPENSENIQILKSISKELNTPLHIFYWDWKTHQQDIFNSALEHGQTVTVKGVLRDLFKTIPEDRFIFTGVISYEQPRFLWEVAENKHPNWDSKSRKLFFLANPLMSRTELQISKRKGTGSFWCNSKRCASTFLNDPIIKEEPNRRFHKPLSLIQFFQNYWPELKFKHKTDPFMGGIKKESWEENRVGSVVKKEKELLKDTYGEVSSVCGPIVHHSFDNRWHFGDIIFIDEIMEG